MSAVIKFQNIFKEYRLGVIGHGTLYRDLQSFIAKIKGKDDPNSIIGLENLENSKKNILALNNINLDINSGEVLGVIGHNGAGKSTLLKVLSRITSPSKGSIKVKGRMASLLEVGTGFHPELTGRENIYLNGAINGLNRNEVSKKLDEIVDFANIERFLDTPVKRYSSGMHVRLGFAVAAHIDPDIFIVDEVLAVGDASFKQKAMDKMENVSKGHGRTVIFVSHNMNSIKSLCSRAILLEEGKIIFDDKPSKTINEYMRRSLADLGHHNTINTKSRSGLGTLKFTKIYYEDKKGFSLNQIISGEELVIVFEYETTDYIEKNSFALDIRFNDLSGIEIASVSSIEMGFNFKDFKKNGKIKITFDNFMLRAGKYIIDIHSSIHYKKRIPLDNIINATVLTVEPGDYFQVGSTNSTGSFLLLDCKLSN
mgnify:CR=1 FL=1